jgi:hypothetical protein
MQRLTLAPDADPTTAADGVRQRLAQALGLPDFVHAAAQIAETGERVRSIFHEILKAN